MPNLQSQDVAIKPLVQTYLLERKTGQEAKGAHARGKVSGTGRRRREKKEEKGDEPPSVSIVPPEKKVQKRKKVEIVESDSESDFDEPPSPPPLERHPPRMSYREILMNRQYEQQKQRAQREVSVIRNFYGNSR